MKLKMDKWTEIILVIGQQKTTFSQDIQRISGITFSHIVQIVQQLEKMKLVTKIQDGRKYRLNLTKEGLEVYKILKELQIILSKKTK